MSPLIGSGEMRKAIIFLLGSALLFLVNTSVAMSRNNQLNVHSPSLRSSAWTGAHIPRMGRSGLGDERHPDEALAAEIKMELEQVGHKGKFSFFDTIGESLEAFACRWGVVRFCIPPKNETEQPPPTTTTTPAPRTTTPAVVELEKEAPTTTTEASSEGDSIADKDKVNATIPSTEQPVTAQPTTTLSPYKDNEGFDEQPSTPNAVPDTTTTPTPEIIPPSSTTEKTPVSSTESTVKTTTPISMPTTTGDTLQGDAKPEEAVSTTPAEGSTTTAPDSVQEREPPSPEAATPTTTSSPTTEKNESSRAVECRDEEIPTSTSSPDQTGPKEGEESSDGDNEAENSKDKEAGSTTPSPNA